MNTQSFQGNQPVFRNLISSNRIIINVGGVRFETFRSTLKSIPDSRLSWLTESSGENGEYDSITGEYFFDRHPAVFSMILNYYRTGKLHAPTSVCGPLFEDELVYWGIDEKQIEPCCWQNYSSHRDAQRTLAELDSVCDEVSEENQSYNEEVAARFGIVEQEKGEKRFFRKAKKQIWHILEHRRSCFGFKVMTWITVTFTLLFVAVFVAGSHIQFRELRPSVNLSMMSTTTKVHKFQRMTQPKPWLLVLDYTCIAYFTTDFLAKIIFCPNRRKLLCSVLSWVDILSLLPFYVTMLICAIRPEDENATFIYVVNCFGVIRIFRILHLARQFPGLKILWHTLKASAKELLLIVFMLLIGVLVFACLIFFAEQVNEHDQNDFRNIPISFWWAVVTMTTLGYGDMWPRTAIGYIVGAGCALCGLLMLALPVPVIVSNFTLYYSHAQAKLKLPRKRNNTLVTVSNVLKSNSVSNSLCDSVHDIVITCDDSQQYHSSGSNRESVDTDVFVDGQVLPSNMYTNVNLLMPQQGSTDSVDSGFKTGSTEISATCSDSPDHHSPDSPESPYEEHVSKSSNAPLARSSTVPEANTDCPHHRLGKRGVMEVHGTGSFKRRHAVRSSRRFTRQSAIPMDV